MKPFFLLIVLFCCLAPCAFGLELFKQLKAGAYLRYEHQNQKSQQTTGFSTLSYKQINHNQIEERLVNSKPNGEVFQEKTSLFDAAGSLLSYKETDHRSGLSIVDIYLKNEVKTTLTKGKQHKELSTRIVDKLVPFEVLTLYLSAHLDSLSQGNTLSFTLFLPQLGLEFEQFTQIGVNATKVKQGEVKTPRGIEPFVEVLVSPTSPLLKMLLPAEKSQFRFTYLTNHPRLLFQFSESQTRSTLVKLSAP